MCSNISLVSNWLRVFSGLSGGGGGGWEEVPVKGVLVGWVTFTVFCDKILVVLGNKQITSFQKSLYIHQK